MKFHEKKWQSSKQIILKWQKLFRHIARGRDHGIAWYQEVRDWYKMTDSLTSDLGLDHVKLLQKYYRFWQLQWSIFDAISIFIFGKLIFRPRLYQKTFFPHTPYRSSLFPCPCFIVRHTWSMCLDLHAGHFCLVFFTSCIGACIYIMLNWPKMHLYTRPLN